MRKRDFLKLSATLLGSSLVAPAYAAGEAAPTPITGGAQPIGPTEHKRRLRKAQALMARHDIDALILEPGSSMTYFSGVQWWRSERLTAIVVPRTGNIAVVTPYFEEPSVRESLALEGEVRTWHEHESPFDLLAGMLRDRKFAHGRIGIESTVRYFVSDGLRRAAAGTTLVAADPVVNGCRMFKSQAELALMRAAAEVTMTAYRRVHAQLHEGMAGADVIALMNQTQSALGGSNPWSMALVGPGSAYPHGTAEKAVVRDGQIVLMDCGCSVHGYQSDISRTFVFGEASKRQREVWQTVRDGQQVAFEAARVGRPAGEVDDAVRAFYQSKGYGPDYRTPGLSHRTGHGIGMDGHEPINFVRGETTKLAPGMCLSNEPGIYIFGEFGVRLEDCLYMTADGPKWFTVPPATLDNPLGTMG
jgi:Xaa-Pro dipeptidase